MATLPSPAGDSVMLKSVPKKSSVVALLVTLLSFSSSVSDPAKASAAHAQDVPFHLRIWLLLQPPKSLSPSEPISSPELELLVPVVPVVETSIEIDAPAFSVPEPVTVRPVAPESVAK